MKYLSIVILGLLFFSLPAGAQGPAADVLQKIGIDQRLGEQVPLDLVFRDETGSEVRLGAYFGKKPVILSLVYYECPMLCTQVLNGLTEGLRPLSFDIGREFEVVTVSFDPKEGPELAAEKKAGYVKDYGREGAADGWHFLTGDQAAIDALTKAVGFRYVYDEASRQFAHSSGIMVLTPQGRLTRYFYGIEYATRDIKLGLMDASEERIGSPVDQVLLYCFHYDPQTGKYGVVIMNVIRLVGVATVLVLGGFIFLMLRRDRRAASHSVRQEA